MIRDAHGPGDAGVDPSRELGSALRGARRQAGRGGGGGGEEGGGGGGPTQKPGSSSCRYRRTTSVRADPHVAPGTFKVTLEVDGVAGESRTFEVRADPASTVTLTQHKAREAFVVEVMDLLARVETIAADLRTRRACGDWRRSGAAAGARAAAGRRGRRTRWPWRRCGRRRRSRFSPCVSVSAVCSMRSTCQARGRALWRPRPEPCAKHSTRRRRTLRRSNARSASSGRPGAAARSTGGPRRRGPSCSPRR